MRAGREYASAWARCHRAMPVPLSNDGCAASIPASIPFRPGHRRVTDCAAAADGEADPREEEERGAVRCLPEAAYDGARDPTDPRPRPALQPPRPATPLA